MNYLKYKSDLLNRTSQIIIFDDSGQVLKSCDTLRNLGNLNHSIFSESPFIEKLRPEIKDLKVGEVLTFDCVSDNLFGKETLCDFRIEIGEQNGKKVIYWLIKDHTEQYKGVESTQKEIDDESEASKLNAEEYIERENIRLKLLAHDLEKEKRIKEKVFRNIQNALRTPIMGLNFLTLSLIDHLDEVNKKRYQQSHKLMTGYLERSINRLVSPSVHEDDSPFKLDHVISAIKDTCSGQKKVNILFHKEFESSIIVGKKYDLFFRLMRMLGLIVECKPDGNIRITFSFNQDSNSIYIAFKVNLLKKTLEQIQANFSKTDESMNATVDGSTLVVTYPVTEIRALKITEGLKKNIQKEKNIVKLQFPYLYKITNKDEGMVLEIIESVLDVVPFELENMNLQYHRKDYKSLARTSHKIKPNFESLEQTQFTKQILEIEHAAINHDDNYLDKNLGNFIENAYKKLAEFKENYI